MSLIKLIEDSVKEFGEGGHISLHPYLWYTAMQDPEFIDAVTRVPVSESKLGLVGELKGIKIFVAADPTPALVYQERIMKALVALQAPELLDFV